MSRRHAARPRPFSAAPEEGAASAAMAALPGNQQPFCVFLLIASVVVISSSYFSVQISCELSGGAEMTVIILL